MELLDHAAGCDWCGVLLADAHLEASAGQDSTLMLRSGTKAWKREMLDRIGEQSGRKPSKRSAWIAAAAAIAVVGSGIGWWVYRENSPQAAYRLLAQAYTQQRPFELRIAGASPGPIRAQRGPASEQPLELNDAQSLIARKLKSEPGNAEWRRARALADLLQQHYDVAIETLEEVRQERSGDPDLLGLLGIAYLGRATPEDILRALEEFSAALTARPNDPVLLFNRAIAYERSGMIESAIKDWDAFLRIEPSGGWAEEARAHRTRDQALIEKAQNGSQNRLADIEPGGQALFDLLARWFPDSKTDPVRLPPPEATSLESELVERYGDWWLTDLLAGSRNPGFLDALLQLQKAEAAARRGEPAARPLVGPRSRQQHRRRKPGHARGLLDRAAGRTLPRDRSHHG